MEKNKNINLNLFDQNVLGDFRVLRLTDGSVRMIKYENEEKPKVTFKPSYTGYNGEQNFNISVERENRTVACVIIIIRSSVNCYIVVGADRAKSLYQRFANISEVSNFIKNNFCRTLLTENDNEKEV